MNQLNNMFFENDEDAKVRVHGNGFVQAELIDGDKLHIWMHDCPHQTVPTLIHNHTSAFTSTILIGKLRNEEYTLGNAHWLPGAEEKYQMYQATIRHDKDTELVRMHRGKYVLLRTRKFIFNHGSTYDFPGGRDLFHATFPESDLVVTKVKRYPEHNPDDSPIILVRSDQKPDNDFDRYQHTEYARSTYNYVKNILNNLYDTLVA